MHPRHLPLHAEHLAVLAALAQAVRNSGQRRTFTYHAMSGYPFGWVTHPGLRGGISVIATEVLLALDHIGLLRVMQADDAARLTVTLTDDGMAHYLRTAGLRSQRTG